MTKSRPPKSLRKYLRKEKARLRRENLDPQEAERRILDLLLGIGGHYTREDVIKGDSNIRMHPNDSNHSSGIRKLESHSKNVKKP